MNLPEWNLTVGEIVAPFGLVGEMKVRLETDFPDRFANLKQVCVRSTEGKGALYAVTSSRPHKGQVLLKLQGVQSIEDTEPLRNSVIQVRSSEAVKLPENEFYIHDLLGCEVVTPDGRTLGKVTDVLRGIANDVYVVGKGKDEILLPSIKDVISEVDLNARRIVATPTPGLIGLDDDEAQTSSDADIETC